LLVGLIVGHIVQIDLVDVWLVGGRVISLFLVIYWLVPDVSSRAIVQ
jgi:hypothetical protein